MSRTYYRRPEMVTGGQLRCFNCQKLFIQHIRGTSYELTLECPRCGTHVEIRCKEPIPFVAEHLLQKQKTESLA